MYIKISHIFICCFFSSVILNTFAVQKSSKLVKGKACITIKGTCSMPICDEGFRFLFV